MKKMRNVCLWVIVLVLACACGSEEKKSAKAPQKIYSASTESDFREIESYDIPSHKKEPAPINKTARPPTRSQEFPPNIPAPVAKIKNPELVVSSNLSLKNEERLQEINQNLAFFCMKHRNDNRFKNEDQCRRFARSVLKSCEKKHRLINTFMVNCIKDRLKKRH